MEQQPQSFLQKMAPRERILLTVTLIVLGTVGYYKFEFEPLQNNREQVSRQIEEADQRIKSFQAALTLAQQGKIQGQIDQVNREVESLKMEIDLTKDRMKEKVADIVHALSRQAKFQKAEMLTLDSREKLIQPKDGISYKEVTLFLTIKSNYPAVGDFIDALEQIPAVMVVRDIEVHRHRQVYPRVETKLTLKLYVM